MREKLGAIPIKRFRPLSQKEIDDDLLMIYRKPSMIQFVCLVLIFATLLNEIVK